MHATIVTLYALVLGGLALFALHRVKLLTLYLLKARRGVPASPPPAAVTPRVCVQCPVYNEPLMIEELLECVTALWWPEARLEVQLLDDSTDGTTEIAAAWLRRNPERAARVRHVRRSRRNGYKAGALAHGMRESSAEFFAVFDADFRPEPDFLERTVPYFQDGGVAVVQARWEFANRRASLLTRFQAVFLDAHFVVEQAARHAAGLFFNFNGTAGVWRRAALEDAGGWTSDTVTEDLDASYRAQARGWRFVYLEDYGVPSELPENLTAFKSQQRRWTKGGIQVARKQLGGLLTGDLPGRVKREATCHLLVGLIHPLAIAFTLLFVPYLVLTQGGGGGIGFYLNPPMVLLFAGGTIGVYLTSQCFRRRDWREGLLWLAAAPLLLAFALAMSVTGTAAVIEGFCQRGGEFVRTPKGGRAVRAGGLVTRWSSRSLFLSIMLAELVLGLVLLGGALYFGHRNTLMIALILIVKSTGFLGMAFWSSLDLWPRPMAAAA